MFTTQAAGGNDSKPLITRSTILILSGFLFGMALRHLGGDGPATLCMFFAAFGVVAWFGLGKVAQLRRLRLVRSTTFEAERRLSTRIDRHIPRLGCARRRRIFDGQPPSSDDQYLTVKHVGSFSG